MAAPEELRPAEERSRHVDRLVKSPLAPPPA